MTTFWKSVIACAAVASLGAAGCEDRNNTGRDTAERLEEDVDRAGERLGETAERAEQRVEQLGEDLDGKAVTFEVAKIDKESRTVELHRANAMIGVTDDKDVQSGSDVINLSFDELAQHVEGDKSAEEIAEELHEGENVDVFMDANQKIKKITY